MDLSHTARLSFVLPPGLSITSVGGYGAGPNDVPEPAMFYLMSLGLLLGAAHSRRLAPRIQAPPGAMFTQWDIRPPLQGTVFE